MELVTGLATAIEQAMGFVAFGECMIELARGADGIARVGFGGDTLNTAIYLARLGVPTAYLTAVGTDAWSTELISNWAREGIDTKLVATHPSRAPGLYAISTDAMGERSFTYWRDQSAARAFFETDIADRMLEQASQARLLYLSGITLAIFNAGEQQRVLQLARDVRANGGQVAFDPNWRPRLWQDVEAFRNAVSALAPTVSIALPGHDDEAAVWGDATPEATRDRWLGLGAGEVVVKSGADGALVASQWVAAPVVDRPLDTTGAGDSFNAGYLALRLAGAAPDAAAAFGAWLAAEVVCYPGAIMPREAMPNPLVLAGGNDFAGGTR